MIESSDGDDRVSKLLIELYEIRYRIPKLKKYIVRSAVEEIKTEFRETLNWLNVFVCQQQVSMPTLIEMGVSSF